MEENTQEPSYLQPSIQPWTVMKYPAIASREKGTWTLPFPSKAILLLIAQPLIDKRPGKDKNREAAQGRIQRESLVEEITRKVAGFSLWTPKFLSRAPRNHWGLKLKARHESFLLGYVGRDFNLRKVISCHPFFHDVACLSPMTMTLEKNRPYYGTLFHAKSCEQWREIQFELQFPFHFTQNFVYRWVKEPSQGR